MDLRGQLFNSQDEFIRASEREVSAFQRQQEIAARLDAIRASKRHPVIQVQPQTTAVERAILRNSQAA